MKVGNVGNLVTTLILLKKIGNVKKVFTRIRIDENLNGAYLTNGRKRYFIKMEDVEKRIGLYTNATKLTDTQFLKRYYK